MSISYERSKGKKDDGRSLLSCHGTINRAVLHFFNRLLLQPEMSAVSIEAINHSYSFLSAVNSTANGIGGGLLLVRPVDILLPFRGV